MKIPTEYEEQCAVIRWARMMSKNGHSELALLHGDASGVRVTPGVAVKMKRAGAVKGWPDLFLPVLGGPFAKAPEKVGYHWIGLFIELKRRRGGVLSDDQAGVLNALEQEGYCVDVCRGADEAIKTIKKYLGID